MSDGGLGAASIQSGFVVAVLVAAILLAERLGGDEMLGRRVFQVAIGFALLLTVFAGTAAFLPAPDSPDVSLFTFQFDFDEEEIQDELARAAESAAQRSSEVGTVHLGIGLALVVAGAALLRRLNVLPGGFLLGGVLLLLLGASVGDALTDLLSGVTSLFNIFSGSAAGEAGQTRDIARFVVLLAGTLVLLWFALWWWEFADDRPQPTAPAAASGPSPPPPPEPPPSGSPPAAPDAGP